jgi:hypothetical protein
MFFATPDMRRELPALRWSDAIKWGQLLEFRPEKAAKPSPTIALIARIIRNHATQ